MKKGIPAILLALLIAAISALAGFIAGRRSARPPAILVQRDTLIVRDTLRLTEFRDIEKKKTETLFVVVRDTVRLQDTLYLQLPRTTKQYTDSLFTAQVSGYEPSLDWLELYPQTRYITTTIRPKPPRWSLGLQAGYGISKQGLTPYIGVGLSYNLWSF